MPGARLRIGKVFFSPADCECEPLPPVHVVPFLAAAAAAVAGIGRPLFAPVPARSGTRAAHAPAGMPACVLPCGAAYASVRPTSGSTAAAAAGRGRGLGQMASFWIFWRKTGQIRKDLLVFTPVEDTGTTNGLCAGVLTRIFARRFELFRMDPELAVC